ncbi:hypothetical protein ACN0IJ_08520 [Shewanella indica]|uniref:hypothetical protein n=1 Tax=Shewanella indica TaxID=768528 RepID=UPI003D3638F8
MLARALYKSPKLLFMDEATSHLDVMNEIRIGEQIKQLAMTRVIVAHRPETIKQADRVLVMHMGNFIPLNLYSSKERKARSVTWYLGSLDLLHGKSCLSQRHGQGVRPTVPLKGRLMSSSSKHN